MKNAATALENIELGRMVHSVAQGIAEAQIALDLNSLRTTESYAKTQIELGGEKASLLDLGFVPNFYQFTETKIELKISVSMTEEQTDEKKTHDSIMNSNTSASVSASIGWFSASAEAKTTTTTTTSSVDARHASRFQYSSEASSSLSTRLVPVPPPPELMRIVRNIKAE